MQVLFCGIDSLFLQWFFIGYWILKTGLDVYPGPFFFLAHSSLFIAFGPRRKN
jgi:hypothetical protein